MNFLGIGPTELLVIGGLAYFLLGPKRMGEAGKTLGKALRELRRQRDELTAMLMHDSEEDVHTRSRPQRPEGITPGSDNGGGAERGSSENSAPPRSGAN